MPGIHDIIDENAGAAFDVADNVHDFALACAFAPFVDDGEGGIDPFGKRTGADHAADVRRHDHDVRRVHVLLDVTGHQGGGEEIVGRDIEEALDLAGVEIDG